MGVFSDDSTWLNARITACETAIVAIETAIITLSASTGMQSYSLDTGQSRQSVTKADVGSLRVQLNDWIILRDIYKARKDGSGFAGRAVW